MKEVVVKVLLLYRVRTKYHSSFFVHAKDMEDAFAMAESFIKQTPYYAKCGADCFVGMEIEPYESIGPIVLPKNLNEI